MGQSQFRKAVKGLKPLRLVLMGASGSGKSKTALKFATYLAKQTGKPTAGIDTEHGRLSLYADEFEFDVIEAEPPFHPKNLIALIHDAENAGYGQLVVDSSTHYYAGTGGLLEIVQDAAKQKFSGNQYYAWAVGTPLHNELIDTIIRSPLHIILTSRSKQQYVETEKNGKKGYEKVGEAMIQKDGLEYELDFALMMDMEHTAHVTKGLNEVDTSVYFKLPDTEAIEAIMKALQKDSTEKPMAEKKVSVEELKTKIQSLWDSAVELPELREGYKKLLKEVEPNKGNFNKVNDVSKLETLLDNMKKLKGE